LKLTIPALLGSTLDNMAVRVSDAQQELARDMAKREQAELAVRESQSRLQQNYLSLASKHPWTTLLLPTLISIAAALQLPKLQVQVSSNGLVIEDDPATVLYERAGATFGNDESVLVFVRDPELFQYDRLEAIRATVARLEASPFVARTESLFTLCRSSTTWCTASPISR
jgi:hypothetical protein